jgi:CheY-like chemotaxis protein
MAKKILLVEDNRDTIDMLQIILEHMGYSFLAATNGKQGLNIAASTLPDLILLDITLPDMNGIVAARQIRQNPKTKSIPIIATTGRASHKDQEMCLQNGCNDYLCKPYTHKQLVFRIEKLLVQ